MAVKAWVEPISGRLMLLPGSEPGSGDLNYAWEQTTPSSLWTVIHNLGKHPSVTTTSLAGKRINGTVTYISANALQIGFNVALPGFAYLN